MDKQNLIKKLQDEIAQGCDARLEAQLSLALEAGLTANEFFIACNSFFYREYSTDVFYSEVAEDACKKNVLQLNLTRSGIYDQLPEGLFYQPAQSKTATQSTMHMAEEYKMNKRKEHAIRRFFMPLENDFFWQRVQLEKEESELLEGLQSGILNNFFTKLWDIDPALPKSLVTYLILLLPYAHRITGNLMLTQQCLQRLLQEQVEVKKIFAPATTASEDQIFKLGKQQLGINMICGSTFHELYPVFEFSIGPLQRSHITDYLEGGGKEKFLKTFFRFFIPADVEVVTRIEVTQKKKSMHLQTANEEEPILGYSTFL